MFRVDPHHRAKGRTVESDVIGHGADDAFRPGRLGCFNADQKFLQRSLCLDDDGVGAGIDKSPCLFLEGAAYLSFGELSERLKQAAKGTDVSQNVSLFAIESLTSYFHAGPIYVNYVVCLRMTSQHDARAAKSIGDEAV